MAHRPWQDTQAHGAESSAEAGATSAATLAPGSREPSPQDRRVSPRRPHRVFQWIAPCIDGRLPEQSMFYQVQCIDISRTGISFFTYEPLPSDELIIAIGTTADAVYVRSRVANNVRVEDSEGVRFRVGCEFVERLGARTETPRAATTRDTDTIPMPIAHPPKPEQTPSDAGSSS
jgi:hypothetical protein